MIITKLLLHLGHIQTYRAWECCQEGNPGPTPPRLCTPVIKLLLVSVFVYFSSFRSCVVAKDDEKFRYDKSQIYYYYYLIRIWGVGGNRPHPSLKPTNCKRSPWLHMQNGQRTTQRRWKGGVGSGDLWSYRAGHRRDVLSTVLRDLCTWCKQRLCGYIFVQCSSNLTTSLKLQTSMWFKIASQI